MKNRLWAAVVIGAISFLRAAEELWFRAKIPIHGVAFWSLAAYFAGIAITYAVTDAFRIKVTKKKISADKVRKERTYGSTWVGTGRRSA